KGCRKKGHIVVAGGDDQPQSEILQLRQDLENLMAAKIDVEQGAIEAAPDGVLKYLLHARHRSDHLTAEIPQHPLDVERDKAFVLGDEDALAGQRIFGIAIQGTPLTRANKSIFSTPDFIGTRHAGSDAAASSPNFFEA